jgi:hypothetical protein
MYRIAVSSSLISRIRPLIGPSFSFGSVSEIASQNDTMADDGVPAARAEAGISVEVVDPRTLVPSDK